MDMSRKLKGCNHPDSKIVRATNEAQGIYMEVKGLRALTATIWGRTEAGIPRKVAGVIDMCNGRSKRDNIDGWVFEYVDAQIKDEEPFVDVLAELGI